jgi:hypothetical protein
MCMMDLVHVYDGSCTCIWWILHVCMMDLVHVYDESFLLILL